MSKRNRLRTIRKPRSAASAQPHKSGTQLPASAIPEVLKGLDGQKFVPFYSKTYIYSNFYALDGLEYDGHSFHSSEQLYFYMKARFFKDSDTAEAILNSKSALQAKRLSLTIANADHNEWCRVSVEKMYEANLSKFSQFEELRAELLETGDMPLVEASPRDFFWGVGVSLKSPNLMDRDLWKGENQLGTVLMQVRQTLRDVK